RDLEALEQHALEREREAVPVEPRALLVRSRLRLRDLAREDRILVVEGLVAARAQDRLAQPLQPEREQQRADEEAERRDRDERLRDEPRGFERVLEILRRDVLAAGRDDQVLLAIGDLEEAVLVELADVAGAEPAILGERGRGRLGILEVALEDRVAADDDLA